MWCEPKRGIAERHRRSRICMPESIVWDSTCSPAISLNKSMGDFYLDTDRSIFNDDDADDSLPMPSGIDCSDWRGWSLFMLGE